jgi:hypothetical protein
MTAAAIHDRKQHVVAVVLEQVVVASVGVATVLASVDAVAAKERLEKQVSQLQGEVQLLKELMEMERKAALIERKTMHAAIVNTEHKVAAVLGTGLPTRFGSRPKS